MAGIPGILPEVRTYLFLLLLSKIYFEISLARPFLAGPPPSPFLAKTKLTTIE